MLELKAKYGTARIMLNSWENVEEAVVTQLYSMLNHPKFNSNEIVIMPDCLHYDTEVLTQNGFKFIHSLDKTDMVAAADGNNEYQQACTRGRVRKSL